MLTISELIMAEVRAPASQRVQQRSRWSFTFSRYDDAINYSDIFKNPTHKIKRVVFGYEVAPMTGTPHLQGYAEFTSVRLSFVKKILPTAHWEPSTKSALHNYIYCTKSGKFDVVGDFKKEAEGKKDLKRKKIPVASILSGLLDEEIVPQIVVSDQYAAHHMYYDKVVPKIRGLQSMHKSFNSWKVKRLYIWQYTVLKRVKEQNDRKITWVFDQRGNNGKSFLARYLNILYGYQMLDG